MMYSVGFPGGMIGDGQLIDGINRQISGVIWTWANNMELAYLDANQWMGYWVFSVQIK